MYQLFSSRFAQIELYFVDCSSAPWMPVKHKILWDYLHQILYLSIEIKKKFITCLEQCDKLAETLLVTSQPSTGVFLKWSNTIQFNGKNSFLTDILPFGSIRSDLGDYFVNTLNHLQINSSKLLQNILIKRKKMYFLQLTCFCLSSSSVNANLTSRPATVGKKNGADLGTFGGCLGLFLSWNMIVLTIKENFNFNDPLHR